MTLYVKSVINITKNGLYWFMLMFLMLGTCIVFCMRFLMAKGMKSTDIIKLDQNM